MELRRLRYFVAVAENGSISKAAQKIFLTQPALSRQIKALEDEIGLLLFERQAHSIRLTPAGEVLLEEARKLLQLLNVPERLWHLPPATFSGGEQQRVNIARGFAAERPILLLDEPTASLDAANRTAVVALIEERKRAGVAVLGIFHDEDVRDRVADRIVDVTQFASGG